MVPADRGNARHGALDTAVRLELELALAQLDAHRGPVAETGQELLAAADRGTPEEGRLRHLEPPGAGRRAGDMVFDGEPSAVEVEPPGAVEAQPVRGGVRVAAALLDQPHGRARRHAIGGELPPPRPAARSAAGGGGPGPRPPPAVDPPPRPGAPAPPPPPRPPPAPRHQR